MKAVVLETRGKEAAVLVEDGTVRIVHGSYSIGDTIEYNEAPRLRLRYWAAAAAVVIAAVGISAGLWVDRNYITYAEVSLDVNPSILYSINKRDRVLSVQAANEDAENVVELLNQESIRFTPLSEAVERTMDILEGEGYLSEETDDYVLINVSADDESRQNRLVDEVEDAMTQTMEQDSTLEYHIDRSDRSTAREAKNNGMSTGRYAVWQEASKVERDGGKPSRDDYATKPVREIIMGKDSPSPGGQARSGQVPGGQAPDGQTPDNNTPNGQSPGTDENTPPSDVDNPGSGAEPAGAPNPPAGANLQADVPQRLEDGDSQRPEDSAAQRPEDSDSQPPQDSAAVPGNSVTQPEEANQQSGAPQRDDAKDSTTDQNESPNTPGTNTDDGNGARQDRSGDKGESSEKADLGDNKAQSNPNGSSDERKQAPASNPDGGKRQTPAGSGGKKPSSSGGNNQGSRSDKSNPGHK